MKSLKIVAITACITGVAHTYMAEANLKKYAKKKGCLIKVETQGAMELKTDYYSKMLTKQMRSYSQ